MRERLAAVGCGTLAMAFALLNFIGAFYGLVARHRSGFSFAMMALGGLVIVIGMLCWWIAVRPKDDEDEDLFHGDRGLALGLIIAVVLILATFTAVMITNRGFWEGLLGR